MGITWSFNFLIKSIIEDEKIDCEFEKVSLYVYSLTSKERNILDDELLTSHNLHLNLIEPKENLGFIYESAIEVPKQAKFNPVKFITSVAKRLSEKNVDIYEKTQASEVSEKDGNFTIHTPYAKISANMLFLQPTHLFKILLNFTFLMQHISHTYLNYILKRISLNLDCMRM